MRLRFLLIVLALLLPAARSAAQTARDDKADAPKSTSEAPRTFALSIAQHRRFTTITIAGSSCQLPCRLALPAGTHSFVASGKATLAGQLSVDGPAQLEIVQERAAHRTAGALLIPLGAIVGSTMWLLHDTCRDWDLACTIAHITVWPLAGAGALVGGAILLAYGRRGPYRLVRVLAEDPPPPRPKLRLKSIDVAPSFSDIRVGATFSF